MITCEGIISYPAIWEPKENQSGQLKYSCQFLVDKSDEQGVKELKAEINKAIEKGKTELWKGKTPKFRYSPLRDGDEELESGEKDDPIYKGKMFFNCSNSNPVVVLGPNAKVLMDQSKLYAGCVCRLEVRPYPFSKNGNNGIGWGLQAVMVVRDGERLDGGINQEQAESMFANFATETSDTDDDLI